MQYCTTLVCCSSLCVCQNTSSVNEFRWCRTTSTHDIADISNESRKYCSNFVDSRLWLKKFSGRSIRTGVHTHNKREIFCSICEEDTKESRGGGEGIIIWYTIQKKPGHHKFTQEKYFWRCCISGMPARAKGLRRKQTLRKNGHILLTMHAAVVVHYKR